MPVIRSEHSKSRPYTQALDDKNLPNNSKVLLLDALRLRHVREVSITDLQFIYEKSRKTIYRWLKPLEKNFYLYKKKLIHPVSKQCIRYALKFYENPEELRQLLSQGVDIIPQPQTEEEAQKHIEISRRGWLA